MSASVAEEAQREPALPLAAVPAAQRLAEQVRRQVVVQPLRVLGDDRRPGRCRSPPPVRAGPRRAGPRRGPCRPAAAASRRAAPSALGRSARRATRTSPSGLNSTAPTLCAVGQVHHGLPQLAACGLRAGDAGRRLRPPDQRGDRGQHQAAALDPAGPGGDAVDQHRRGFAGIAERRAALPRQPLQRRPAALDLAAGWPARPPPGRRLRPQARRQRARPGRGIDVEQPAAAQRVLHAAESSPAAAAKRSPRIGPSAPIAPT